MTLGAETQLVPGLRPPAPWRCKFPLLPQNHKPALLLLLPSAVPQREGGCFLNCFLGLRMDRRLCLDPANSSKQILSSLSPLSHPLPITPSFCPRRQSVSKAHLVPKRKMPTQALQTRSSSELTVPGCGTLHPHTQGGVCLERWQRILQEPVWPGLCLPPAHTLHSQPKHTHKVCDQPH